MTKEQLRTISDLVAIAHDEYDGCPSYRDDLERFDLLLAEIKAEAQSAPGNAAAIREALEKIRHEWGRGLINARTCLSTDSDVDRVSRLFEEEIDAALAAPARNCDRPECATAKGAIAVLRANPCADHDFCKEQTDCAECATRWLLAKAEGGAE